MIEAFPTMYPAIIDEVFSRELQTTLAIDSPHEARRLGHPSLATADLLLGLLHRRNAVRQILHRSGVDIKKIRLGIESLVGYDAPLIPGSKIGFTPPIKTVLRYTIDEARRLGSQRVDNEHLFLGLVREGDGIAAGVLGSKGFYLDEARQAVWFHIGKEGKYSSLLR